MLRTGFRYLTSPIQYVVDWPIRTYHRLNQSVSSHRKLLNENIELHYQQVLLKGKLQRLMSLQKENKQLRQLLEYKHAPDSQTHFILAELLSVKSDPYRQMLTIDRGTRSNVVVGQAVFDAYGVMGQVIEVGPLTATVMLITDPKSAVPVKNSRTGERAILIGAGQYGGLSLMHLDRTSKVKVGDELLTSGLGKRFPEGYPVGVVTFISRNSNEAFIRIDVKPAAKISKSRLMLLTGHDSQNQNLVASLNKSKKKSTHEV